MALIPWGGDNSTNYTTAYNNGAAYKPGDTLEASRMNAALRMSSLIAAAIGNRFGLTDDIDASLTDVQSSGILKHIGYSFDASNNRSEINFAGSARYSSENDFYIGSRFGKTIINSGTGAEINGDIDVNDAAANAIIKVDSYGPRILKNRNINDYSYEGIYGGIGSFALTKFYSNSDDSTNIGSGYDSTLLNSFSWVRVFLDHRHPFTIPTFQKFTSGKKFFDVYNSYLQLKTWLEMVTGTNGTVNAYYTENFNAWLHISIGEDNVIPDIKAHCYAFTYNTITNRIEFRIEGYRIYVNGGTLLRKSIKLIWILADPTGLSPVNDEFANSVTIDGNSLPNSSAQLTITFHSLSGLYDYLMCNSSLLGGINL